MINYMHHVFLPIGSANVTPKQTRALHYMISGLPLRVDVLKAMSIKIAYTVDEYLTVTW